MADEGCSFCGSSDDRGNWRQIDDIYVNIVEQKAIKYLRDKRSLFIGLPKGSLNRRDLNRGYARLLINGIGWNPKGYILPDEDGARPDNLNLENSSERVKLEQMKPKVMPEKLHSKSLDLAICGTDIMFEYLYDHASLEDYLLVSLLFGRVDYYFMARAPFAKRACVHSLNSVLGDWRHELGRPVVCISERPNMALAALEAAEIQAGFILGVNEDMCKKLEDIRNDPKNMNEYMEALERKLFARVQLKKVDGSIELLLRNGENGDAGFECVSSGEAMRQNGILPMHYRPYFTSYAGLFKQKKGEEVPAFIRTLSEHFGSDGYPIALGKIHDMERADNLRQVYKKELNAAKEWVRDESMKLAERLSEASRKYYPLGENGQRRRDSYYYEGERVNPLLEGLRGWEIATLKEQEKPGELSWELKGKGEVEIVRYLEFRMRHGKRH